MVFEKTGNEGSRMMGENFQDETSELRAELAAEDREQVEEWLVGDEADLKRLLPADELEDEIMLKRYLLGELDEEKRAQLENRLVNVEGYFAQMRIIEKELIDDYVLGLLSSAEAERFEAHFLSTAERRQSVRMSAALKDSSHAKPEVKKSSGADRQPSAWIRSALVFTGLINPSSVREARPYVWQLELISGQARGESTAGRVNLPSGIHELWLDLMLENDECQVYRAELRTVDDETISVHNDLHARQVETGKVVTLRLPVDYLQANDYLLVLEAILDNEYERISTYYFRIVAAE